MPQNLMRTIVEYSSREFAKIQKIFPNLDYDNKTKKITGELGFCARYKNISCDNASKWVIELCDPDRNDCIEDCYEIEIHLGEPNTWDGLPTVIESGGRIKKLAQSLDKRLDDLHIYEDNSCCLGIFPPYDSLYKFIRNAVYPYFVWQAYYEKYKEVPPVGECPHNEEQSIAMRVKDEENNLKFLLAKQGKKPKGNFRNEPCPCGSEKKYKKCCFHSNKERETEIRNGLAYLKNMRKNKLTTPKNQK